jgi:guanine deaminase
MPPTVYYGSLINPVSLDSYDALPRCAIGVAENGLIDWIIQDVDSSLLQEAMVQNGYIEADVIDLKNGQFLMPGLIDTHIVCGTFSISLLYRLIT